MKCRHLPWRLSCLFCKGWPTHRPWAPFPGNQISLCWQRLCTHRPSASSFAEPVLREHMRCVAEHNTMTVVMCMDLCHLCRFIIFDRVSNIIGTFDYIYRMLKSKINNSLAFAKRTGTCAKKHSRFRSCNNLIKCEQRPSPPMVV